MEKPHEFYMKEALAAAREAFALGEVPIGAVLVRDGEILARGYNRREMDGDPTAHAEVVALREAAKKLGGWRLPRAVLYVTIEPCPMCAGALVQARIGHLVYGAADVKGGGVDSLYRIGQDPRLNHTYTVTPGVMAGDCARLMQEFFRSRR